MACINATAMDKDRKLFLLKEQGLIALAKKINNLHIQVQYLEEIGKPKLFLYDFRKLGYEWRLYKGENYIRCANCKILTKKNSNRTKYCRDCAKITKKKQNQIYYQKLLGN